jgi:hypothetical protein
MLEHTNQPASEYKARTISCQASADPLVLCEQLTGRNKIMLFLLIPIMLAVFGLFACRRPNSRTIHVQGNHDIIVGTANSLAQSTGPGHSEAIVAADRWGDVAAIVHSSNARNWGATGIFVDGISIPDSASHQQRPILWAGRGQSLPDPTQPLIISRYGNPVAALSSIGNGLHQATISVLVNMLDFNMDLEDAIRAPSEQYPQPPRLNIPLVFEGDFSNRLINGVGKRGLDVNVMPKNSPLANDHRGYVVGIAIDKTGRRHAVKNMLTPGTALAY